MRSACGKNFFEAGSQIEGRIPAGGADFGDRGGGVEDVSGPGGGVANFRTEAGEGEHHFRQAKNGNGVAGGHIIDAGHGRGEGGMFKGSRDIIDVNEIAGLVAFAKNGERGTGAGCLEKFGNRGRIGTAGILTGAINVEKT